MFELIIELENGKTYIWDAIPEEVAYALANKTKELHGVETITISEILG